MREALKGKTIFIVDDETEIREMLAFEFQMLGCKTLEASSGNEAIKVLSKNHVDVVITDIRMPQGTGIELLDEIKKNNAATPIVFLVTGYADITDAEALRKGAEAIFAKPFDLQTLIETVADRLVHPQKTTFHQ